MCLLGFVDQPVHYFFSSYLLAENPRHLWFLIVLFEIFIVFNIFYGFFKHKVALLFVLSLYLLKDIMPYTFQLSNFCGYFIYFYLGVIGMSNYEKISRFFDTNVLFKTILVFILWSSLHLSAWYLSSVPIVFPLLQLLSAIFGILLLYVICYRLYTILNERHTFREHYVYNRFVGEVVDNSYGIYLFHPMIIYISFYYMSDMWSNPYLLSTLVLFLALFFSYIFTKLVKGIKFGFIIGE